MRKIKKLISTVVCIALLSAFPVNVCADVIMMPEFSEIALDPFVMESVFIENRYYKVIEDCSVMSSPESNEAVHAAKKGEELNIYRAYTDDKKIRWGFVEEYNGWVNMAYLEVIYDTFSFEEEHSKELENYDGELDSFSPDENVYLWSYPMSSDVKNVISESDWNYLFISESDHPVYTDENGNKWINIENGLGWVFLDAPGEKEIMNETKNGTEKTTVSEASETTTSALEESEAVSESEPETSSETSSEDTSEETISETVSETSSEAETSELTDETSTEKSEPSENNNSSSFTLPIILAVSAAAVSAILLFILKKKPDKKD